MILVFDGTIIQLISAIALFADKSEDATLKFVAETFKIYDDDAFFKAKPAPDDGVIAFLNKLRGG